MPNVGRNEGVEAVHWHVNVECLRVVCGEDLGGEAWSAGEQFDLGCEGRR